MAKTIEEIMSGVTDGGYDYVNINDCIRIAKMFANSKLEEASEQSIEMMYERKPEVQTEGLQLRTFQVCYATPKQSILNLREEV